MDAMTVRVAVVVTLVIVWPPSAHFALAQEGWGSVPLTIAAPTSPQSARVAVDASGNATAVWVEQVSVLPLSESILKVARFEKATGQWGVPGALYASGGRRIIAPDLFVDGAGNTVVAWTSAFRFGSYLAHAARFTVAAGSWTFVPLPTSTGSSGGPLVSGNLAGDVVIVWTEQSFASMGIPPRVVGIRATRYSVDTGTWSAPEPLAATLPVQPWPADVAMDAAGNVHVVWNGATTVQATRFSAVTATWGGVVDLSGTVAGLTLASPAPRVATTETGSAVATWSQDNDVVSARDAAVGTWSAPVVVATSAGAATTHPAIDAAGNVVLAWTSGACDARNLEVARYAVGTSTWSPAVPLASPGSLTGTPDLAVDPVGNAFVAWSQRQDAATSRVRAARFAISAGAWTATEDLAAGVPEALTGGVAADANGSAFALRGQASGAPLVASRWNAAPAAPVVTAAAPSTGALSVSFALPPTTDPALAPTNIEYSVDGAAWLARFPVSDTSPLAINRLTDGVTYGLRMRSTNSAGPGPAVGPIAVRSGVQAEPSALRVVANAGHMVTLAWTAPAGLVPSGYLLEGGTAPQQTLARVPTGSTATTMTVTAPTGIFFVRIVAVAGPLRLGTSNEVRVVVDVPAPPSAPETLLGLANGANLALSWTNTQNGGSATGLVLSVAGPVSGTLPLPVTETFAFSGVPPGTYTFSVTAVNAAGVSAPSPAVTLAFPGACSGLPFPPTDLTATSTAGNVFLAWSAPASGPAITGFVLQVSGSITGTLPVTARTLVATAGPGSYTVRVSAVNACGTSVATPPQTIVVP